MHSIRAPYSSASIWILETQLHLVSLLYFLVCSLGDKLPTCIDDHLILAAYSSSCCHHSAEGTNGQMPNLDLINVVESSARYRGVATQLYRRQLDGDVTAGNYATAAYIKALKTMLTMMKNQAMGSPTGEHGVFLR